jgi:lysophospholipase L1-like esterase
VKCHRRIVLVLGILTLVWPGAAVAAERSYLKANDQILTLGDSITAQGVYQDYMQEILNTLYPGAGIRIVNRGVGGMMAPDGIGVLTDYLNTGKPTVVTVMFGVNDTRWDPAGPEEKAAEYVQHMRGIIQIGKGNDIPVILLRETHFSHNAISEPWVAQVNRTLEHLLKAEDGLAAENNVPVIDVGAAYREALEDAWYKDLRYEFTPDVIHPTQPGQAAMAAEILRALGAGLPLATGQRGPLRLIRPARLSLKAVDGAGIIKEDGGFTVNLRCRNLMGRPVSGRVTIAAATHQDTKDATLGPYGMQILSFEIPSGQMKGRWGCLPIYVVFRGGLSGHAREEDLYAAGHVLFYYSRISSAAHEPLVVTGQDFRAVQGATNRLCTVQRAAISCCHEGVKIEFRWADGNTVPAQPNFRNIFGKEIAALLDLEGRAQPCDAVEFYFDLRPDESTGRYTSNVDSDPEGVVRLGVYKTKEDDRIAAKLLAPDDVAEGDTVLTDNGDDTYTLEFKRRQEGSTLGFSMRVTDADEFGLGKGPVFYLTGRPNVSFEPMSYLRLTTGAPGIFYRVGY